MYLWIVEMYISTKSRHSLGRIEAIYLRNRHFGNLSILCKTLKTVGISFISYIGVHFVNCYYNVIAWTFLCKGVVDPVIKNCASVTTDSIQVILKLHVGVLPW